MKRALALPLAIFVLLLAGIHAVEVAEANFVPSAPYILIDSPEANRTYTTNSVWLNITLKTFFDYYSWNTSRVVECSLDGKEKTVIPVVYEAYEDNYSTVTGSLLLSELSEGSHSVTVYAKYDYIDPWKLFYSNSNTSRFIIELSETIPSPVITSSPEPTFTSEPTPTPPLTLSSGEVVQTKQLMDFLRVVIAGVVGIIGVGLLVYFKKRKR